MHIALTVNKTRIYFKLVVPGARCCSQEKNAALLISNALQSTQGSTLYTREYSEAALCRDDNSLYR